MRGIGCTLLAVILLVIVAVLAGEVWLFLFLLPLAEEIGGALSLILLALVCTVVGVKLLRWRMAGMQAALLTGRLGRLGVALIGAILLIFPGFATAALGILLQVPFIQALGGKIMQRFLVTLASRAMGGMGGMQGMGPGFAGFPGAAGFPGGGAGGPAGAMSAQQMAAAMQAMQAQMRSGKLGPGPASGRPPKTYDVKAKK